MPAGRCWWRPRGAAGWPGSCRRLLGPWRRPLATHDPGKIVLDLAVAVALGGDAACDIAVLRAQPGVFGPVASDPTVSRLIAPGRGRRRRAGGDHAARAAARERVWGCGAPVQDGQVVIDLDATLLDAHSEKQQASRTWKKGFGFHPLLGFVDHGTGGGGEPVAELLRPGRAGSNTAADHVVVLDAALAQVPALLRGPRRTGGWRCWCAPTPPAPPRSSPATSPRPGSSSPWGEPRPLRHPTALAALPAAAWTPAYQARKPRAAETGVQIDPRDGAWVAEATGLVDLSAWPPGTRLILRKERPTPARSCAPPTPTACGSPGS